MGPGANTNLIDVVSDGLLSRSNRSVTDQFSHAPARPRCLSQPCRVPEANGRVLEIGIGSGLNLPFYSHNVDRLIGLDPSAKLRNLRPNTPSLELIEGSGEAIPLESASVDTVVTTWTLCSIPDAGRALREMHRVLRPTGRLLFVEHGRAPEPNVRWWQDHLTPAWKRIGGGCHLNRAIQSLIEDAGFQFDRFETGYMRGPKPLAFMYEGTARPS
jgi:ubiquinone/menaquinone biosynthesis C-methylase UbiE